MSYVRRAFAVLMFIGYFLVEILLSNLRMALDVIRPQQLVRPGIVALPIRAQTDLQVALLANLVNFTPGTLVLDVSSDRTVFYVHFMYLEEVEQFRHFEDRFLRMFR